MPKILQYSFGVGIGAIALGALAGWPWETAGIFAGILVALGWLLWGVLSLADEIQGVLGMAFALAGGVTKTLFTSGMPAPAIEPETDIHTNSASEKLGELVPTAGRRVRVNDRHGWHWIEMGTDTDTPYRRRVMAFLVLGNRVGSFKFRDLRDRTLSDGTRIEYKLWNRFTDDLVTAGLFLKDRQKGTRPRTGDVTWCFERLSNGVALEHEPVYGEIILNPADGYKAP